MPDPPKPLSRVAIRAQKAGLRAFIQYARGDPLLSSYEERFVSDLRRLTQYNDPLPSRKQAAIIRKIKAKIGYGNPDWVPPVDVSPFDEGSDEF